jgi:hypothetical protein
MTKTIRRQGIREKHALQETRRAGDVRSLFYLHRDWPQPSWRHGAMVVSKFGIHISCQVGDAITVTVEVI